MEKMIIKKIIVSMILLFLLLTLLSIHVTLAETDGFYFSDMKGHWAEEAVYDMARQGVIVGFNDGTFRPNEPVQVDQFLKMILMTLSEVRADGKRVWKEEFKDRLTLYTKNTLDFGSPGFDFAIAESGYWAKPFNDQAENMGIIVKYDRWGGKFNQPLNREGAAYLLHSTLLLFEHDEYGQYSLLSETQIKDLDKAEYLPISVRQVYTKGLMRGYNDGTFGFQKTVTRAEAVVMMYRILDKSNRNPYKHDISPLPHTKVQVYRNDFVDDRMVVFPSWDLKNGFDKVVEAKDLSKGVVDQNGLWFMFYQDQAQKEAEMLRQSNVETVFDNQKFDMRIIVEESGNHYTLFISTREEALQNHTKALSHITNFLFGEASDRFLIELDEYRSQTAKRQFTPTRTTIGGREIHAQSANGGAFVYITVGPKR
jgi:hypothetical protein